MSKQAITVKEAAAQVANPETGEIQNIRYFEGCPKQYRFNGQTGRFNIDGITDQGAKLTIQPLAWRIFKDDLFGRNRTDDWAEIFFVDATGCVSGIMFNNSSVTELMDLVPRLLYAGKSLSDVVLTVTCEKKTTDKGGEKVTWFLAKFDFEEAPPKLQPCWPSSPRKTRCTAGTPLRRTLFTFQFRIPTLCRRPGQSPPVWPKGPKRPPSWPPDRDSSNSGPAQKPGPLISRPQARAHEIHQDHHRHKLRRLRRGFNDPAASNRGR